MQSEYFKKYVLITDGLFKVMMYDLSIETPNETVGKVVQENRQFP
jgi:hypothetical protein